MTKITIPNPEFGDVHVCADGPKGFVQISQNAEDVYVPADKLEQFIAALRNQAKLNLVIGSPLE
jgi:hypothetical protein